MISNLQTENKTNIKQSKHRPIIVIYIHFHTNIFAFKIEHLLLYHFESRHLYGMEKKLLLLTNWFFVFIFWKICCMKINIQFIIYSRFESWMCAVYFVSLALDINFVWNCYPVNCCHYIFSTHELFYISRCQSKLKSIVLTLWDW